jgi:hypothetical protein
LAAAQLAGEDFLVGLDRHRADEARQAVRAKYDFGFEWAGFLVVVLLAGEAAAGLFLFAGEGADSWDLGQISGSRWRWWVISKMTSSTRSRRSAVGKSRVVTEVTLGCFFGTGEGDSVGIDIGFLRRPRSELGLPGRRTVSR